jgi:hypothetical protein
MGLYLKRTSLPVAAVSVGCVLSEIVKHDSKFGRGFWIYLAVCVGLMLAASFAAMVAARWAVSRDQGG